MAVRGLLPTALIALVAGAPGAVAMSLDQAVAAALAFRPDLQRSGALAEAAAAAVDEALAGYLPEVALEAMGGYRYRYSDQAAVELIDEAPPIGILTSSFGAEAEEEGADDDGGFSGEGFAEFGGGLELRQLVFDGYGLEARVAAAEARLAGSLAGLQATVEDVAYDAVRAYLDLLRNQDFAAIALANLKNHRSLYGQVRSLGDAGRVSQADVSQAAARLALAEAGLAERVGGLAEAVAIFVATVGTAPEDLAPPPLPAERPVSEAAAVAQALQAHPDLAVGAAALEEGQAAVAGAEAAYWPRLEAVAGAHADRNITALDGDTLQAEIGAEANWTLYRGGGDAALVALAEAELAAAGHDLDETARLVAEDVAVAYRRLLTAEAVADPLARHVRAARQVVAAYRDQFAIGRRSLLDLLDAQTELNAAQLRESDARWRLLLAHYELQYAMGSLTAVLEVQPPAGG